MLLEQLQHAVATGRPFRSRSPRRLLASTAAALAFGLCAISSSNAAADDRSIRPFTVHVPQAALDDLRRRVNATRWPDRETVDDFSQGVQLEKLNLYFPDAAACS